MLYSIRIKAWNGYTLLFSSRRVDFILAQTDLKELFIIDAIVPHPTFKPEYPDPMDNADMIWQKLKECVPFEAYLKIRYMMR